MVVFNGCTMAMAGDSSAATASKEESMFRGSRVKMKSLIGQLPLLYTEIGLESQDMS
jgi:hypothetical protein